MNISIGSFPLRVFLYTTIIVSLFFLMPPGFSQTFNSQAVSNKSTNVPLAQPSPNDLKELSRLLSDPAILEWLQKSAAGISEIKNVSGNTSNSLRNQLEKSTLAIRERMGEIEKAARMLPQAPMTISQIWQSRIDSSQTLRTLTFIIIFLFIAAGLEWLFWQYFLPTRQRLEFKSYKNLKERVNSALKRILLLGSALGVFAIGSIGAFLSFSWQPTVQHIALNFLISIIVIRVALAITKFLLAPNVPSLRFVPLSSGPAIRLTKWAGLATVVTVFGVLISDTFAYLSTLPNPPVAAASAAFSVAILSALTITIILILAVWRMSKSAKKIRPEAISSSERKSNLVPALLTLLIITSVVLWLLGAEEIMWSLIIVSLLIPAIQMVSKLISHLFDEAEGEAGFALQTQSPDYSGELDTLPDEASSGDDGETGIYDLHRPVTIRLSRFAMIIIAMAGLAHVWDVSILSLSSANNFSGKVFSIAVDITVALLIADLIWVWAKTAIDRRMADFGDLISVGGEGGGSAGPEARMATLLPILRKILMITIFLMVSLSVLSSIGINIGPILAGAGVAGIAIGFGAQALVRDIVSGIFFLLDDAFRVGEYIEMGELRGTVESMSLRSLRVRHHLGAIHTIPFGELKALTNYSRDWVIMKMEFRVPFETDIKLVKKLIKKVNLELEANEAYGHHLLQPLKSQGVRRMEEFNMVIGVKFMATPGEQWLIRRDAYQRIRDVFTENGIDFAQRNVKVEVISDQPITPEIKKVALSAAQEVTENTLPPAPPKDEP